VTQETFLPRQVQHFDKKERLSKVLKLDDAREIPGTNKHRLFRWEMENVLEGSKTTLEYLKIELNTGVSDSMFSQRMLK
jgi:hypothetical protein